MDPPQIKLASARSRFFTAARFSRQKDSSRQKEDDADLAFVLSISASVEKKFALEEGKFKTAESKETLPWPTASDYYTLKGIVGVGSHTTVYSATCEIKDENCAVKMIDLNKWRPNDLDCLLKEVATMSSLIHENITTYYGTFVEKENLWLVMGLMSSSLLDVIHRKQKAGSCRNGVFNEDVIATIMTGVVNGLVFLHDHGFIHKDIRAENILLGEDGAVKISDFSIVNYISKTRKYIGSPRWLAPEITSQPDKDMYTDKADIWSLGITAIEAATGAPPYHKSSTMKVLLMISLNAPPTLETDADAIDQYNNYGKTFRSFIADCLIKEPSKRPPAKELLFHKFFNKSKDREFLQEVLAGIPCSAEPRFLKPEKEEDLPHPTVKKEWVLTQAELQTDDLQDVANESPTSVLEDENKLIQTSSHSAQPVLCRASHAFDDRSTNSFWSTTSKAKGQGGLTRQIVLKIRRPHLGTPMVLKTSIHKKRDLLDIEFTYDPARDKPEPIAEDLVREGLIDPRDRQPVATHLKKLLEPTFKSETDPPSVTFRLQSDTSSDETVSEWNFVGYAALIIKSSAPSLTQSHSDYII